MARPGKFKQRIGKPLLSTNPASPGKSATAPGRMFKGMGLPNASSIAPGKTRVREKPEIIGPGPVQVQWRRR